jgi:hypothetical protein
MLRVCSGLFLFVLFSAVIAIQLKAAPQRTASVDPDGRVLNVPYSAERLFKHEEKSADGHISRSESRGSKARDSKGRTYSADERKWTYLGSLKSEMLYEIDDPVTRTDTRWDSSSKIVKVIHTPQTTTESGSSKLRTLAILRGEHGDFVEAAMIAAGAMVEKLGTKTIGAVVTEGTRTSNSEGTVHETWYSPELKIVVLQTHDDPHTGKNRDELVDIVRGEPPDAKKYHAPADYVVRDVQIP